MHLFANILIFCSVLLFAASIFAVQQLVKKLPLGKVRNNWNILSFFIAGFMIGLLVCLPMIWTGKIILTTLTIPVIGITVSAFLLMLCFLTYQTTRDIQEAIVVDQTSIIDPVLEIYNRRYYERRIDEETQRSRRYELPLSLIIFEVDGFNNIVKSHGRLVGDVILRKVSDFIVNSVRASDIVARYEDQKIVIAATQTDKEMTMKLADRLRSKIEELNVLQANEENKSESLHVTVSAGISTVDENIKTGFDLSDIAEIALQKSIKQGHNKVYTLDAAEIKPAGEMIESAAA